MTLDEMIEELTALRGKVGKDLALRIVIRSGLMGDQYEIGATQLVDAYHDQMVLMFCGEHVATMDWPRETAV